MVVLDKSDIESARESWNRLNKKQKKDYVVLVYRILFNDFPAYKPLFPRDLEEIRDNILSSIDFLISHLDQPDQLKAEFTRLGQTHFDARVSADMYPNMVSTHLKVMQEISGEALSVGDIASWEKLFQYLTQQILLAYPEQG